MPSSKARVPTQRADRYLAQLVDHLGQLNHPRPDASGRPGHGQGGQHSQHGQHGRQHGQHSHDRAAARAHGGPPDVRHIERTGSHARVEFDWGQLLLTATSTELILHVQADDPHGLARGQALIGRRIATIGRRDDLVVAWQPTSSG